jgi:hypothetical protein
VGPRFGTPRNVPSSPGLFGVALTGRKKFTGRRGDTQKNIYKLQHPFNELNNKETN